MTTKEHMVYMSRLAEQAERYDEMTEHMKMVAQLGKELNVEERNLLSVAFKNAVGSRRGSWRIVSSVENKELAKGNTANAEISKGYREQIEAELNDICNQILKLLDDHLLPNSTSGESKVFYYKMKGDYYRYIAEFTSGEAKDKAAEAAHEAYKEATDIAEKELAKTHPIRLGLALNFSVFYYEVLGKTDEACKMARNSFQSAIAELDTVGEESYKDSTLIMQLLRDNLSLWATDQNETTEE